MLLQRMGAFFGCLVRGRSIQMLFLLMDLKVLQHQRQMLSQLMDLKVRLCSPQMQPQLKVLQHQRQMLFQLMDH